MKRLLVLLLVALPALGQIISVTPNRGTRNGGDAITIHIPGLTTCTRPGGFCSPPAVFFGGTQAPLVTLMAIDTIGVITPPHDPGGVTLAIRKDSGETEQITGFTFVEPNTAFENYEDVILPISLGNTTVAGNYGSRWASELWLRNDNPWTVEVVNQNAFCGAGCARLVLLEPGQTLRGDAFGGPIPFGVRLSVQRGGIDKVRFALRVADVSRGSLNSGTDLPAVRVTDPRMQGTIVLLNVPIDALSRAALRIYNPTQPKGSVPFRIYAMDGSTAPLVTGTLFTQRPQTDVAFASIDDLGAAYPQLAAAGRVRIEVGGGFGPPVWAFVAVTNNDTQLITTITPE